ncbi:MAG TPA: hypothetical protein VGD26_06190 [Chitinophagaceae bacterium]
MKSLVWLKSIYALMILLLVQVTVLGQEEGSSTTTTSSSTDIKISETTSENWYASPWVWIAGAAVFILLLVALLRGGGDKTVTRDTDRVVVKKTVERDTDTDVV